MNYLRPALFATAMALTLVACSKGEEAMDSAETQGGNELLSYVPADTPYLGANLQPLPDDVIDAFLLRLDPVFQEMQAQLNLALSKMEGVEQEETGSEPSARLMLAMLRELDGKLNRSGLESLGLDIQSHKVVYGLGAFPVFRLGLSDADALRATIQRVLDGAGVIAPEQTYQGVSYWRITDDGHHDAAAGLYLSIMENHLAAGLFPLMAEEELLPAFLGTELPSGSDAQARLAELNRTQGYTPYGSGILDLHKLADQFLQADSVLAKTMAAQGEFDPESITDECVSEIHGIIDNMPRMTMGTTELTPSAVAYQYRLETRQTLAQQMIGLVSDIPAADALSERMLEFSFGMRFGPVRDFLREKATAIAEDPYQCEHLLDLNERASEALAQLDRPMPPFVNNFRGVRASLSHIAMSEESIPADARGYLALHVEKPEMFIGMAQMFLPDLSELAMEPGGPPIRLPETLIPQPGLVAFAAMSTDAIGLAMGEGEESGLPEFLDRDAGSEGTFLSVNYDMAAYIDYTQDISARYQPDDGDYDPVTEIAGAMQTAFKEMADRSHTEMSFSAEGLVIDGRMTFK